MIVGFAGPASNLILAAIAGTIVRIFPSVVTGFLPFHLVVPYLSLERYGLLIIFGLLWIGSLDYILWSIAALLLRQLLSGLG